MYSFSPTQFRRSQDGPMTASSGDKTRIGLIVLAVGLLLYIWRHLVEDRTGIRLREETPDMPPPTSEQRQTAAPAV